MTDLEFISLFNVEELPECAVGLYVLKRWLENDPGTIARLEAGEPFDLLAYSSPENVHFVSWLEHLRGCPTCLLLRSHQAA